MLAQLTQSGNPLPDIVLIVDDDQAVRDALKFALELDGMSIRTCSSGEELLGHPDLGRADCLVLDYRMPEMNGLALLAELRRRGIDLPVVLIISNLTKEIERRANAAGVAKILEKPLIEDVLMKSIRRILGK